MNSFIDSHAHIYLNDFNGQIENIIDNSIKNNVDKILMPNINFKTVNSMKNLSLKYEGICFSMLGLHPCYVEDNYEKEINDIFDFFDSKVIAIGEIGLDYFQSENTFINQLKAFEIQCDIAINKKLPIVIHTRNSIDESINVIKKYSNKNIKGVFHCFTGDLKQANQIIDLGFKIGVGGILTFKNSDLKNVISKIDLSSILLETDSPYLSPEPNRGKLNEPSNIKYVAKKLSDILSIPIEVVAKVTSQNANNLFDLSS